MATKSHGHGTRTLAKALDEFYFVEITLPIQEKEKAIAAAKQLRDARYAIMKIAPRSQSDAMTLIELKKIANVTGKVAQRAVESLITEGEVEVTCVGRKGDAKRYWLSAGSHEKKASDR